MWLTHNQSVNYFLRLQNNKEEESDKTGSSFFVSLRQHVDDLFLYGDVLVHKHPFALLMGFTN